MAALQAIDSTAALTAVIFLSTYLVLALGRVPFFRIDRAGAALVGAVLMVALTGLSLDEAYRAIDYRTIILLFGMMVLVASLRLARFFAALARAILQRASHPRSLIVLVVLASGLLSAVFVNDTVCLVFTPILIEIATARGQRPLPYLLALATASNIGSVATMTGNPQNMLIGSVSGLSYRTFSAHLAPVACVGLVIDAVWICWLFRGELTPAPPTPSARGSRAAHRPLMIKGVMVSLAVLAGFLAGMDPALVSALAAATVLVTRRVKPEKIYREVDWSLLMLFVGLFVVMAGVSRSRLDLAFFEALGPVGLGTATGLTLAAAALSNIISNVPAVMLFVPWIPRLPSPETGWLVLAMASTLAGNLTVLGSIANLIVIEGGRRRGHAITFVDYLKVGAPVTVVTLAFGAWWLS